MNFLLHLHIYIKLIAIILFTWKRKDLDPSFLIETLNVIGGLPISTQPKSILRGETQTLLEAGALK